MTTLVRSTPSSRNTCKASRPAWLPAEVCTVIGARVSRWVAAQARRFRSTPCVRPFASTTHLRNAALTPVAAMPLRMSRVKSSIIGSRGRSSSSPGPRCSYWWEPRRRCRARRHDDVDLGLLRDPLDTGDVAPQSPHGRVDDRVDAERLQLVELGDGVGDPDVFVPPVAHAVVLDVLGGEDEHVLVHGVAPSSAVPTGPRTVSTVGTAGPPGNSGRVASGSARAAAV